MCGGPLKSKFRKNQPLIFVDRLIGLNTVHMHKTCAKTYDKQFQAEHVSCREVKQLIPWEMSDDRMD
jgi:hypothetical protein